MELSERIKQTVRDVKDFPKEGIVFKDISTILLNADLCKDIVAHLAEKHRNSNLQGIAGIESRGFLFGFPLVHGPRYSFHHDPQKRKVALQ